MARFTSKQLDALHATGEQFEPSAPGGCEFSRAAGWYLSGVTVTRPAGSAWFQVAGLRRLAHMREPLIHSAVPAAQGSAGMRRQNHQL